MRESIGVCHFGQENCETHFFCEKIQPYLLFSFNKYESCFFQILGQIILMQGCRPWGCRKCHCTPQILEDQLILSQPGGRLYWHPGYYRFFIGTKKKNGDFQFFLCVSKLEKMGKKVCWGMKLSRFFLHK